MPLTQEDIAAMAGTSRATVNRVLREEERLGAVALARGRTTLVDRSGAREPLPPQLARQVASMRVSSKKRSQRSAGSSPASALTVAG